jgi:hypothetical protein
MFIALRVDRPSFFIDELCSQPVGNGLWDFVQAFQDESNL